MRLNTKTIAIVLIPAILGLAAGSARAIPEAGGFFTQGPGQVNFLQANETGYGFGTLDTEIAFSLASNPGTYMGFQLRNDANGPAHQAMFELLREGFANNIPVATDVDFPAGSPNGTARRVWWAR
jgi:hypothetical protein